MSQKIFTNQNPARLLLVDDHPMLRRGLADLLGLKLIYLLQDKPVTVEKL